MIYFFPFYVKYMAGVHANLIELVKKILSKKPKRVLIQLPPGLMPHSQALSNLLHEDGVDAIICAEPCFGACDIRDAEAKRLGCDLLVHVGHRDFGLLTETPVLYYEWYEEIDPVPILKKQLTCIDDYKKVGLISSVNFAHLLKKVASFLRKNHKKPVIGGHILGCDVKNAAQIEKKVDCFLFVGSGRFHPLGLAMLIKKPVFVLDLELGEIKKMDTDKFERQRHASIALAKGAKKFGILVSTKPGQVMIKLAEEIKEKLEMAGKRGWIFALDEISQNKLLGLDVDCWINCACPRIAIDNRMQFDKPILNMDELEEMLKQLDCIRAISS